jgi:hypothetical protein
MHQNFFRSRTNGLVMLRYPYNLPMAPMDNRDVPNEEEEVNQRKNALLRTKNPHIII